MKKPSFHIAAPEEIKQAKTTDIYFVRTEQILKARGLDRRVGMAEFTANDLPEGWPWGIFCGLEEVLLLMEGLPVDLKAIPEGTLFEAKDQTGVRVPVMMVEGPYSSFCLYETPMLGMICQATGVATKSARIRQAAGSAQLLAFGTRRMHPAIAPMLDRASYLGGFDAVSNVLGAERIGKPPRGTMPHALIVAFGDPAAAWKAFDGEIEPSVPRIALIDTYSDEKEEALLAAETLKGRLAGVRLDTPGSRRGNMPDLVREVRWELDLRGHRKVRIIVSGGLDEGEIPALMAAGVDGFGVGTAISNAPTVNFAMDLVEMNGAPCAKRGKFGGRKAPWGCPRCLGIRVLPTAERGLRCLACRGKMEPLFRLYLKKGKRVGKLPPVDQLREKVLDQLERLKRSGYG